MVHPVMTHNTHLTTMSVNFKCSKVAQYTHTCNLICAHKKSKVFTYADFHRGGGMHPSIMFISLILRFTQIRQQMWTLSTQTHLHPSVSMAFTAASFGVVTSDKCIRQTDISYTKYNSYRSINTESIYRNSFTPLNKVQASQRRFSRNSYFLNNF